MIPPVRRLIATLTRRCLLVRRSGWSRDEVVSVSVGLGEHCEGVFLLPVERRVVAHGRINCDLGLMSYLVHFVFLSTSATHLDT